MFTRHRYKGFTLIELLIMLGLLASVGTVIGAILFSTLRGSSKTNVLLDVRENGNYAISQMGKMLRNARVLNDPYPCTVPPSPTPLPQYRAITMTSLDGGVTKFECIPVQNQSGYYIASNSAPLIDRVGFKATTCYFTCTQATASDFPTISVFFTLKQKGGNQIIENNATVSFQTSVVLRNLSR